MFTQYTQENPVGLLSQPLGEGAVTTHRRKTGLRTARRLPRRAVR